MEKRRGGLRALGAEIPRIAGAALGKRGFGEAQLVTQWEAVIGEDLAHKLSPERISFPRGERRSGTLRLRVASAFATEAQHLEPVLIELGRWGSQEALTTDRELSTSALLIALKTVFDAGASRDGVVALRLDDEPFTLTIAQGSLDIRAGWTDDADVALETDAATLRAYAFGRETLGAVEVGHRLTVTGDRALAEQLGHMFPAPRRA